MLVVTSIPTTAHDATSQPKFHLDVFRAGQAHGPQHDLGEAASRDFPCASWDRLTIVVHASDLDFLVPPLGGLVKVGVIRCQAGGGWLHIYMKTVR